MIEALRQQILAAEARFREAKPRRYRRQEALQEGEWRAVDSPERIRQRLRSLSSMSNEFSVELSRSESALGGLAPATSFNPLERIINENDLLSITFLRRGAVVSKSVGRVVVRNQFGRFDGYGTGFMVSPRLMLTNNHVLRTPAGAAQSSIQFDYYETAPGQPTTPSSYRLEPQVFFQTDFDLDYTLVAVAERNEQGHKVRDRGWNPLIPQSGKAVVGERVNIIQHPGGEPLQVAIHDNKIVDLVDAFLHYTTDTNRGSSGSPVYNDQWEVAALHHAGVVERDAQGRILMLNGEPWNGSDATVGQISWVSNEGVRISSIVEHLQSKLTLLTAAQRRLFNEVLFARPNLEVANDKAVIALPNNGAPIAQAQVDDQGGISFTLPIEVRVGLPEGNVQITAHTGAVADDAPSSGMPAAPLLEQPGAPTADGLVSSLLTRVGGCAQQPYYDAAADQADRGNYYDGLTPEGLSRPALFRKLSTLLEKTHSRVLSYREARLEHLYPCVDLHPDTQLRSIYSGVPFSPEELIRRDLEIAAEHEHLMREALARETFFDQDTLDDLIGQLEDRRPYNCEHVVPQSWFNRAQPMKADLHHLFACEPGCNSFRSNLAYFDFPEEEEAVRTECGRREGSRFEPEAGRGAVARATLYFILRYPQRIRSSDRRLVRERLDTLLQWHKDNEVGLYEKHRNATIYSAQGNRNPLIDHPTWCDAIDFRVGLG